MEAVSWYRALTLPSRALQLPIFRRSRLETVQITNLENTQNKTDTPHVSRDQKPTLDTKVNLRAQVTPSRAGFWFRGAGYTLVTAWTLFYTSAGPWFANKFAKLTGIMPRAKGYSSTLASPSPNQICIPTYRADAFYQNQLGAKAINDAFKQAGVEPKSVDLNGNYILFDDPREAALFKKLYLGTKSPFKLVSTGGAKAFFLEPFDETSVLDRWIFDFSIDDIRQNSSLNCYFNGQLIGCCNDTDSFQEMKSNIRIRTYKLDQDNLGKVMENMVGEVRINGEIIEVPFSGKDGLDKFMGPIGFERSLTGDAKLGPIYSYALEKYFQTRGNDLWRLPPGYAIVITGKDHSLYPVSRVPRDTLIQALKQVPDTVITVATWFTFDEMKNGLLGKVGYQNNHTQVSHTKAEQFKSQTVTHLAQIMQSPVTVEPNKELNSDVFFDIPLSIFGTRDADKDAKGDSAIKPKEEKKDTSKKGRRAGEGKCTKSNGNSSVNEEKVEKENDKSLIKSSPEKVQTCHVYNVTDFQPYLDDELGRESFVATLEDAHGDSDGKANTIRLKEKDFYEKIGLINLPKPLTPSPFEGFAFLFLGIPCVRGTRNLELWIKRRRVAA